MATEPTSPQRFLAIIQKLRDCFAKEEVKGLRSDFCRKCAAENSSNPFELKCQHEGGWEERYVPRGVVWDILRQQMDDVRQLFELTTQTNPRFQAKDHNWSDFRRRLLGSTGSDPTEDNEEDAIARIFSTIIHVRDLSIEAEPWTNFVELGCTTIDTDFRDSALPFNQDTAKKFFGTDGGSSFCSSQLRFTALVLRVDRHVPVRGEDRRRPYQRSRFLGQGAYGVVYAVKIAAWHYRSDPDSVNKGATELAVKHIRIDPDQAENELTIATKFLKSPRVHNNIARTLAAFRFPAYISLFSKKALSNFTVYMESCPPSNLQGKTVIYEEILKIADALDFLHKGSNKYRYYHFDVKPDNILVYGPDSSNNTSHGVVFKIADFGISYVVHQDQKSYLKKQLSTVSANANMDDFSPYIAPEGMGDYTNADWRADVWSFGAFLCTALVWLSDCSDTRGMKAIEAFSTRRIEAAEKSANSGQDYFFIQVGGSISSLRPGDLITNLKIYTLNTAISEWFEALGKFGRPKQRRNDAKALSVNERALYSNAWTLIKGQILIPDLTKRQSMKTNCRALRAAIRNVQMTEPSDQSQDSSATLRRDVLHNSSADLRNNLHNKKQDHGCEGSWSVEFGKDSDKETREVLGCCFSPDGRHVLFLSATKVVVRRLSPEQGLTALQDCRPPRDHKWTAVCCSDTIIYAVSSNREHSLTILSWFSFDQLVQSSEPRQTYPLKSKCSSFAVERVSSHPSDSDVLVCIATLRGANLKPTRRIFVLKITVLKAWLDSSRATALEDRNYLCDPPKTMELLPWLSLELNNDNELCTNRLIRALGFDTGRGKSETSKDGQYIILVEGSLLKDTGHSAEGERLSWWDSQSGELCYSNPIEDRQGIDYPRQCFTSWCTARGKLILLCYNIFYTLYDLDDPDAQAQAQGQLRTQLIHICASRTGTNFYGLGATRAKGGKRLAIFETILKEKGSRSWEVEVNGENAICDKITCKNFENLSGCAVMLPKEDRRRMLLVAYHSEVRGSVERLKVIG